MPVKIDSYAKAVKAMIETNLDGALGGMAAHIRDTAKMRAPEKTYVLRNTVYINRGYLSRTIGFGAPYHKYQERGYTTGPITHYTPPAHGGHPQAHYLESSAEEAVKRGLDPWLGGKKR